MHKQLRFRNLDSIEDASADFHYYMHDQEWHENSLVAELLIKKPRRCAIATVLLPTSVAMSSTR